MSLQNLAKAQINKVFVGQGIFPCPILVSLHFQGSLLKKITLEKAKTFALSSFDNKFVTDWFYLYLKGVHSPFPLPLTCNAPSFTKLVLEELKNIPFGKTLSYKEVAKNIGAPQKARAVGRACNSNPFPFVIPCHRVIGANGKLGGYAYGIELKEALLDFEKKTSALPVL